MGLEFPPVNKLWLPPKPAIIRPAPARPKLGSFLPGWFPGARAAAGGPATITFDTSGFSTSDTANYSIMVFLDAVGTYDHYLVGVASRASATTRVNTSLSLGGAAGTDIGSHTANSSGNGNYLYFWILDASGVGGVSTCAVNWNAAMARCGVVIWGITGLKSTTPTDTVNDTNNNPLDNPIDVEAGGCVAVIACTQATTTATAVGVSENADFQIESNLTVWGGSANFATAQTNLNVGCQLGGAGTSPIMLGRAFR